MDGLGDGLDRGVLDGDQGGALGGFGLLPLALFLLAHALLFFDLLLNGEEPDAVLDDLLLDFAFVVSLLVLETVLGEQEGAFDVGFDVQLLGRVLDHLLYIITRG